MVAPDSRASHRLSLLDRFRVLLGRKSKPSELKILCDQCQDILARELQQGCTPEIDREVDTLRHRLARSTPRYDVANGDAYHVEDLWVHLSRLGLFDELLEFVDRCALPLRPGLRTFLGYCQSAYATSAARGRAYRETHPDDQICVLGCVVWGHEYVENFLRINLRSMLSPGNLPGLSRQFRVVLNIVTDEPGRAQIESHPVHDELVRVADVEFTMIAPDAAALLRQDNVVRNFYVQFGMLEHCAVFFAQGAASHLFMIPVDCVVADGSLVAMADTRLQGYECCGSGNIVANTETFLPALDERFRGGPITISATELATLALRHAHHYFRSQILAAENSDFGMYPRELFWPVPGGVEIHSVFIHPLFTAAPALSRYRRKHFANIDYGMIPRMFLSSEKICILEKAELAYVNNFTARDRLYQTTGRPFSVADFCKSHENTYPVQKSLFPRRQFLPCSLDGWTPCSEVERDVAEIAAELIGRDDREPRRAGKAEKRA